MNGRKELDEKGKGEGEGESKKEEEGGDASRRCIICAYLFCLFHVCVKLY